MKGNFMDMEMKKICKRCLLEDFGESDLLKSVQDYIALLPEGERAGDALREKRLYICRKCPHLQNGMCRLCGCFVEARTAKLSQRCPDVPARWKGGL